MRYLALLLVLLFASTGCSQRDCSGRYTYEVSDWTEDQLSRIRLAAANWNAFAGHEVITLSEGDGDTCHINHVADVGHGKSGMQRAASGNLDIETTGLHRIETLVMHEMGHGLGLEHVDDVHAVMSPITFPGGTFNATDWEECVRAGVCR